MTSLRMRILLLMSTIALLAGACGGKPAVVNLGVDLYLHPDSAKPKDLILQAAVREQLDAIATRRRDQVHVRVFEGVAYLSGSVKDPCSKDEAQRAAATTQVTVEDGSGGQTAIKALRVENQVEVTTDKNCRAGGG